jgi:hypothetical protein
MMVRDDDIPYLDATLPMLRIMCDDLVIMHNGPNHRGMDLICSYMTEGDKLIPNEQGDTPDYSVLRNIMLQNTDKGGWVLRWDPDELPTTTKRGGGLVALGDYITKHLPAKATKVATPCFHMVTETQCLSIEYGFAHVRAFKYTEGVWWEGNVHENLRCPGNTHTIPLALGMASVHWSYFSQKRLERKERAYARVPGSGHGVGTLTRNIKAGLRDIPPNISWIAPEGWLERIRELD